MRSSTITTLPVGALLWATAALAVEPTLPVFDAANFANPKPNPYISLEIGARQVLAGRGTEAGKSYGEVNSQTVTGPGRVLLGVQTTQILDEVVKDGRVAERTFDYYATDKAGDLWYFGEDVTDYLYDAAGNLTGTDNKSAWLAGVNGALPGIALPANPQPGLTLFQEQAPVDGAMDYFEVVALDATVDGPGGKFEGVLKTYESNTSDPNSREFKYFAKGKGMIRGEDDLSAARDNPALVMELLP